MQVLQPTGWPRPSGYANGIKARGNLVFVAGMVGWNEQGAFPGDDMAAQIKQALLNTVAVLEQGGAGPEHVARMTWYVTNKAAYAADAKKIGRIYRAIMGRHYPAMAVVEVSALMEDAALVEIETTAVVPD